MATLDRPQSAKTDARREAYKALVVYDEVRSFRDESSQNGWLSMVNARDRRTWTRFCRGGARASVGGPYRPAMVALVLNADAAISRRFALIP